LARHTEATFWHVVPPVSGGHTDVPSAPAELGGGVITLTSFPLAEYYKCSTKDALLIERNFEASSCFFNANEMYTVGTVNAVAV